MKRTPFSRTLLMIAAIFLVLAGTSPVMAKPSTLLILPLNVHAENDLGFLREGILRMLTSRFTMGDEVVVVCPDKTREAVQGLAGPIDTDLARNAGRKLDADYVFFGNLTQFGEGMSIDATMLNMKEEGAPLVFFDQCTELDDVIPRIDRIAGKVNKKVFNRVTYTEAPTVEETRKRAEQYAHPEKLMGITPSVQNQEEKEDVPYWKIWKHLEKLPDIW